MGRRPKASRFMPGVYVFPGGATEPDDRRVRAASPLDATVTGLLKVGGCAARARAMAITAVRETFEETGLMLGAPGDPGLDDHPGWSCWREAGLAPALGCLDLTARAITPARLPIRFHARFFLAGARQVHGAIGGDGELEDVGWVAVEEAAELPLASVQRFLLGHLRAALAGEAKARPVITTRNGQRRVRYE